MFSYCGSQRVGDRGGTRQGAPAEVPPRIFDPFFTTTETDTGLGLATAHTIVEKHGVRLRVESRPGEGTVYHVILPAARGVTVEAKTEAVAGGARCWRGARKGRKLRNQKLFCRIAARCDTIGNTRKIIS